MKAKLKYRMISWVAEKYNVHPQTLRSVGAGRPCCSPTRSRGNTRLYDEEACEQLESILTLTRDLGVNLAGVDIILNLKQSDQKTSGRKRVLTTHDSAHCPESTVKCLGTIRW